MLPTMFAVQFVADKANHWLRESHVYMIGKKGINDFATFPHLYI